MSGLSFHTHFSNHYNSPAKLFLLAIFLSVAVKLLLVPTYHSTDLEVHRNWLTLLQPRGAENAAATGDSTHAQDTLMSTVVPYFDEETCSQHTLDYPMLFFYFQYVLSLIYQFIFKFVTDYWIRGLWPSLADLDYTSPQWQDWTFWNMQQKDIVSILSNETYYCAGFDYKYQNASLGFQQGDSVSEELLHTRIGNPFENLKALLLERRSHVPQQYPLPLLLLLRMSVIFSDALLYLSLFLLFVKGVKYVGNISGLATDAQIYGTTASKERGKRFSLIDHHLFKWLLLVALHPSLLILDHVHFQFNGMLIGILLISMYFMLQRQFLLGAFLFSVLLCFKHLYIYVLPAYIVTLVHYYIFHRIRPHVHRHHQNAHGTDKQSPRKHALPEFPSFWTICKRFLSLSLVTGCVPLLSLLPIVYLYRNAYSPLEIVLQIKSRLFPFHRGLTHAYWAPNFWALYNGLDKVLSLVLGVKSAGTSTASLTGGLVGTNQGTHVVLPKVLPSYTLVLSLFFSFLLPLFILDQRRKSNSYAQVFLKACIHSSMAFFMFGWHVHEKAIVTVFIPLFLYEAYYFNEKHAHLSFCFQYIGTYSLLPLLFRSEELPIKYALFVTYYVLSSRWLLHRERSRRTTTENLELLWCISGTVALELFQYVIHPVLIGQNRLQFLPLMLISLYCAVTVFYFWMRLLRKHLIS